MDTTVTGNSDKDLPNSDKEETLREAGGRAFHSRADLVPKE